MFKHIISLLTRYIIPFFTTPKPHGHTHATDIGYKLGTPPPDFVGIQPGESLANKVIYNNAGIPTGIRILSGDGIFFRALQEKYKSLEGRHFDSFDSFLHHHDQI